MSSTGHRATLLRRLRDSGLVAPVLNDSAREQKLQNNLPPQPQDHAVDANTNDSNFTEGQLNSIATASREIANDAARAAVQVLQSSTSHTTDDRVPPTFDLTTQQQQATSLSDVCKHAAPFQDVPAQYVKDIQSGEFFELSKLLPKNLSTLDENDNLVLTLDNSVVRVSN